MYTSRRFIPSLYKGYVLAEEYLASDSIEDIDSFIAGKYCLHINADGTVFEPATKNVRIAHDVTFGITSTIDLSDNYSAVIVLPNEEGTYTSNTQYMDSLIAADIPVLQHIIVNLDEPYPFDENCSEYHNPCPIVPALPEYR